MQEFPFPHHSFDDSERGVYRLISGEPTRPTGAPSAADVPDVGTRMGLAGVREIVLIHGTFAGNDIVGLMRRLSRFSPRVTRLMKQLGKQWFDQMASEVGNYTDEYADRMSAMLPTDPETHETIPVRRFCWSGENHLLGRACGVLSLMQSVLQRDWTPSDRVLFLAHSHGGNLLAMWSLLLAGSEASKQEFLRFTEPHYRSADPSQNSSQSWQTLRSAMLDPNHSRLPQMDFVTFGTPLRYRWSPGCTDRLLHFVQHRPLISDEPWRATLPRSPRDVIEAIGGDYIQQLGINGTDFPHAFYAFRSRRDERHLRGLFEPRVRHRDLIRHLKLGQRVSLDGTTLLVDYGSSPDRLNEKLFGHGVYTCSPWLAMHLRAIAEAFY